MLRIWLKTTITFKEIQVQTLHNNNHQFLSSSQLFLAGFFSMQKKSDLISPATLDGFAAMT